MKRVLAIAVVLSLGNASIAVAGETLLQAAARAAEDLVAAEASSARAAQANAALPAVTKTTQARPRSHYQQTPPGIESSGIGRGAKVLLGLAVAGALAGIMLSIDGRVEDSTPSTKGERTNKPF